jgi:uncharacterized protein
METPANPASRKLKAAEYSDEERSALLQQARRSIRAALANADEPVAAPNEHLLQPRGAFTTLHLNDTLRGCIGYIEPLHPLWETVAKTARAAAFDDPRFPPLTLEELGKVRIELSVMSMIEPIAAQDVEVGIHGLIVSQNGRRGLLLPQVAPEWGWDRETFLSQTCVKAGLPTDAWKNGAQLQAFTAEVFGE